MADILTPDLCVIGAGAGGLAVAEAARAYGASVVLVERGKPGGNALNTGAIPAHALYAAAARAHAMRDAGVFGVGTEAIKVSFRRVHDHVEQVINAVSPAKSAARLEALGAEIIAGEAGFLDKRTLGVGDTQIRAKAFVIATGARTAVPAIPGLEDVPYFTTETILDNTRKLTHLAIIGGGPIGLALAQAYTRLGTQVTVVEPATPLPGIDPELAAVALRRLAEEGVTILTHSSVVAVQARSMGIGVVVRTGDDETMLDVSHILVATDRFPDIDGLALEKAGVRRGKGGPNPLHLTSGLRTSNSRVYAVGDVTGAAQSAHAAARQAEIIVRHAVLGIAGKADPLLVPRLVSTDPEIAELGLNETQARTRHGTGFKVTRWSFADIDRARTTRQTYGLAKLLTDARGNIIGAGIVGAGAGELIALFSLAMSAGLKASQLADFVAPYPSMAEIAARLGAEFRRGDKQRPLLQRWLAFRRILG